MPSILELATNLGKEVLNVTANAVKTGEAYAEESTIIKRRDLCNSCEHLLKETTRCGVCGYFMQIKVKFITAKCPVGKW